MKVNATHKRLGVGVEDADFDLVFVKPPGIGGDERHQDVLDVREVQEGVFHVNQCQAFGGAGVVFARTVVECGLWIEVARTGIGAAVAGIQARSVVDGCVGGKVACVRVGASSAGFEIARSVVVGGVGGEVAGIGVGASSKGGF